MLGPTGAGGSAISNFGWGGVVWPKKENPKNEKKNFLERHPPVDPAWKKTPSALITLPDCWSPKITLNTNPFDPPITINATGGDVVFDDDVGFLPLGIKNAPNRFLTPPPTGQEMTGIQKMIGWFLEA